MVAMGAMEILLLLGIGGALPGDLLSLIDAETYFRARQVPITVEKMLELAGTQPTDPKGKVARLLAIRMLGQEPAEVQKEKQAIVKVLEPLAQQKLGQEAHGFTALYARRTLQRLGVKPGTPGPEAAARKLTDAFQWLPKEVTVVAGGRRPPDTAADFEDAKQLRDLVKQMVPPQTMEELYKVAEAVGNVRIDSFAFGYAPDPKQQAEGNMYLRFTGAVDHKSLVAYLRNLLPASAAIKELPPAGGKAVTMLDLGRTGPAVALVGDTDLLLVGHIGPPKALGQNPDSMIPLIEVMLKVRAGAAPNALQGSLADELKAIAPETLGLVLGAVPAEVRAGLAGGPLPAIPERIKLIMLPAAKGGLDLRFRGKFENATAAKAFADGVGQLRQKGLDALKNRPPLPPAAKIPPKAFDLMRSALESLKMQPRDDSAVGGMQVTGELLQLLPFLFFGPGPAPPMPPQAVPKQKQSWLRGPAGTGAPLAAAAG
jgi:hypothetical protein